VSWPVLTNIAANLCGANIWRPLSLKINTDPSSIPVQLLKVFTAFYETRARYCTLSLAKVNPVHCLTPYVLSVHHNIVFQCRPEHPGLPRSELCMHRFLSCVIWLLHNICLKSPNYVFFILSLLLMLLRYKWSHHYLSGHPQSPSII
jgi:hypothetical protein